MGQYGDTRRGRAGHLFRATEIDVMQRQPRAHERPRLDTFGAWRGIFFVGLTLLALTISAFFWTKSRGAYDELGRAVPVNALVMGPIFYLLNRPLRGRRVWAIGTCLPDRRGHSFCNFCLHGHFSLSLKPRPSRSGLSAQLSWQKYLA